MRRISSLTEAASSPFPICWMTICMSTLYSETHVYTTFRTSGIVECVLKGLLFVHVSTRLSTRFERNLNLRSKPNREWDQFYWSMYPPPFEVRSPRSNQNPNITLALHRQPLLPPHLPHLHRRSHPPWVHPALPPSQTPAASVLPPAVFQAWG